MDVCVCIQYMRPWSALSMIQTIDVRWRMRNDMMQIKLRTCHFNCKPWIPFQHFSISCKVVPESPISFQDNLYSGLGPKLPLIHSRHSLIWGACRTFQCIPLPTQFQNCTCPRVTWCLPHYLYPLNHPLLCTCLKNHNPNSNTFPHVVRRTRCKYIIGHKIW